MSGDRFGRRYKVVLTSPAKKVFAKADQALTKKLVRCFERLEEDPRNHPNIKALKGQLAGYYRYRVGNYRVVYRISDERVEVLVVTIAHRGQVYG